MRAVECARTVLRRLSASALTAILFVLAANPGTLPGHLVFYGKTIEKYADAEKAAMGGKVMESSRAATALAAALAVVQQKANPKPARTHHAAARTGMKRAFGTDASEEEEDVKVTGEQKKSETTAPIAKASVDDVYMNRRVAKHFGKILFFGSIVRHDVEHEPDYPALWYVLYDDDDDETLERKEVERLLALYARPSISRRDKHPNGLDRSGGAV